MNDRTTLREGHGDRSIIRRLLPMTLREKEEYESRFPPPKVVLTYGLPLSINGHEIISIHKSFKVRRNIPQIWASPNCGLSWDEQIASGELPEYRTYKGDIRSQLWAEEERRLANWHARMK